MNKEVRYLALDHVRALAAFMVFCAHFLHGFNNYPIRSDYVPLFPLFSFFEEGGTGVSLFMVLSGYLFAKILDGKQINYRLFIQARLLRLMPLLIFVIIIEGFRQSLYGVSWIDYLKWISRGIYGPQLPNGGWSITCELHFYILLPFLLIALRRSPAFGFAMIAAVIGLRTWLAIFNEEPGVRWFAYWTTVGRFDQFLLGMLAFYYRDKLPKDSQLLLLLGLAYVAYYNLFNMLGAWQNAPDRMLVTHTTVEGIIYGVFIAWYDRPCPAGPISRFIGLIGKTSYSMYLLHFFFVFAAAHYLSRYLPLTNFYIALPVAALTFLSFTPLMFLSYRFIESPFFRLKKSYARPAEPQAALPMADIIKASPQ